MHPDLVVALEAARAGAVVIRQGMVNGPEIHMKGEVDPVTAVDDAAEAAIFEVIAQSHPGEAVLGEESGGAAWDADRVWIVDPLDGTVNFVHGIPQVAVSVAVWEAGRPIAGVVIDVTTAEEFSASLGDGAYLNGSPIRVSTVPGLGESLVSTGFPYDRRQKASAYADVVGAVLAEAQGIRRLGSAALDLAWLAAGRFDAYWEFGLSPWDAAAGVLLVTEAGGHVTDHAGRPHDLGSITLVAGNPHVHETLRKIVESHMPEHLA